MKIDLVYTYVNGNDEEWLKERSKYSQEGDNGACRYRDNDELVYSLRSVERFAPWINKVFIVSNSKPPKWLNLDSDKLRYVYHEEFMPKEILPCYNSNVIEAYISNIPELSEHYLYACDDMMFGNKVSPDFFFTNGKPNIRMCVQNDYAESYYFSIILQAQKMIEDKYGLRLNSLPWHNIDPYVKSENINCINEFKEQYDNASRNRLREKNDIQRVLFHYYYIANNRCRYTKYDISNHDKLRWYRLKSFLFPSLFFDFYFDNIDSFFRYKKPQKLFERGPKVFCLNDSEGTTDEDLKKYRDLLNRLFPDKSGFEK